MEQNDLIDLDMYVALVKASPRVTAVPFDAARMVVQGMTDVSLKNIANTDPDGKKYWQVTYKELHEAARMPENAGIIVIGKTCRLMGLTTWRLNDGYHVAFSDAQLAILKARFKA